MICERVELIDDPLPRGAALNMAIDEALLETLGELPVLRVYRWARPAVSFGFFAEFAPVQAAYPAHEWVRRWTGGGVVEHGADFTYSLIVPRAHLLAAVRPAESYRLIHLALSQAMPGAEIAADDAPKVSQSCFENPVRHDLVMGNRKLAGAAQRRTRRGLLHQGSALALIEGRALAGQMAETLIERSLRGAELTRAEELVRERYGTSGWLTRR